VNRLGRERAGRAKPTRGTAIRADEKVIWQRWSAPLPKTGPVEIALVVAHNLAETAIMAVIATARGEETPGF